jgi:hypothetical protein
LHGANSGVLGVVCSLKCQTLETETTFQGDTQENINEEELIRDQKLDDLAMKQLTEKIKKGGIKIYVGHTEILELVFRLKPREAFKEQVCFYNLLHIGEKSLKVGTDDDRINFYRQAVAPETPWVHIAYNDCENQEAIAFLNDNKFLLVYDIKKGFISKYTMVNLYGKILKMEFTINDCLLICNSKGECIIFSLDYMTVKYKFWLPLTHVISVETIWNETFHICYINSPNEVYCVKNIQKRSEYIFDSVNSKEIESMKVRGHVIHVKSNVNVIVLLTEEMHFITLRKKTMTLINDFCFSETIPAHLKQNFKGTDMFDSIIKSDL